MQTRQRALQRIFLSTPSARRATRIWVVREMILPISIHALREEGDVFAGFNRGDLFDFYPRPPRGGRRENPCERSERQKISIHALREEGDPPLPNINHT